MTTNLQQANPSAATMLATEHWSLLGTRSMLWNEALSRASVFLTVLSAAVVALALAGDATGFGDSFTIFALVLLPPVLFLGVTTFARLVEVNVVDIQLVLAMNRLRHGYLDMAPELAPYFTASTHDDWAGMLATNTLGRPATQPVLTFILVDTPTVVATLDAAVAAALAALAAHALGAGGVVMALAGAVAFVGLWVTLFTVQLRTMAACRTGDAPHFPTPAA
jgi:hypothetical protein